ncbi:MAG TPA: DUF1425 domain-containing protein [Opitutaceae bacterium]|nr:DUF1425 domain-containing protein [Opitutaceae bacterium]
MKHHWKPFCLIALVAAFVAGCHTTAGSNESFDTTKYTIESTDKFVLLDQTPQGAVACTGLQERILPDGRLEVVANVKNREKQRVKLQLDCVFKDEQGASTGDQTSVQSLALPENVTEAVKFTSANNLARKYTIRVREVR